MAHDQQLWSLSKKEGTHGFSADYYHFSEVPFNAYEKQKMCPIMVPGYTNSTALITVVIIYNH